MSIYNIADELREIAETSKKITVVEFNYHWGTINSFNYKIQSLRVVNRKSLQLYVKEKGRRVTTIVNLKDNFAIYKDWDTPKLSSPCDKRFDLAKLYEAFDSIGKTKIVERSLRTMAA